MSPRAALRADAPEGYEIVIDATVGRSRSSAGDRPDAHGRHDDDLRITGEQDEWPVKLYEIFRREPTLKGSFAQQLMFDRAVAALRSGAVDTTGIISHRFSLDDYQGALDAISDSSVVKSVIEPRQVIMRAVTRRRA